MNIIFHHPLPLDPNSKSASGIRPLRMLNAFIALGYKVDIVSGYAEERKKSVKEIKEKIAKGVYYSFVYSESSTMPTIMTERHHFPTHPFLDSGFLKFCKKNNIPIGLFYRDIYWLFDEYGNNLSFIKRTAAKLAYRFDLLIYNRTVTKLYLPSKEMGRYVPVVDSIKFEALPPGHLQNSVASEPRLEANKLKLFFVGGMSYHYQLHVLFEVVTELPDVELTVCTRQDEWQTMKHEYPELTENIKVIHKVGAEMEKYLVACDVAVLYVKPQEYWEFASPVKLYEYLGFHKPILASKGTLSGEFVQENSIGWTIAYDKGSLKSHLQELLKQPKVISDVEKTLENISLNHSWIARAQQVVDGLSK